MNNNFVLKDYARKSVFSSFLPGISGIKGVPIWCYYVNRGQGVVSFGVEDKDHSIMEFYPAHQAYQNVKTTGFRTFIKMKDQYFEPFSREENEHSMNIEMNRLNIEEVDEVHKLRTNVSYITLPNEEIGGLVRKVTFQNLSDVKMTFEVLDGMPAVIPYDVGLEAIKTMGQTVKAWMQVERLESKVPYFKSRASSDDSATVTQVLGGNYSLCVTEKNEQLGAIVDPAIVFDYDNSMQVAQGFKQSSLAEMYQKSQVVSNQLPCSFYGTTVELEASETFTMYQMIGQVDKREILDKFLEKTLDVDYFEEKEQIATALTEKLCQVIHTKTGHKAFDTYCKYTYMDNVLRGGYPIQLPGGKIFYVYSRKHGDIERDYNYFRMLPEYYSQGNGNFRDVNQNRRMDNFFTPYVKDENMNKFYSMIQLDGYNPLAVEKVTYTLDEAEARKIFEKQEIEKIVGVAEIGERDKDELIIYLTKEFTPGGFYQKLNDIGVNADEAKSALFEQVIEKAEENFNCDFGEGYWSDHWTYNLDLVENYLAINPDKKSEMLLEEKYTYYCTQVPILPRAKRYVVTENGVRQYNFLDEEVERTDGEKLVRSEFGKGEVVKVSLLEKLFVLNITKFAALDAYGMGVEMEGGKPGWYDALNGLPGLFGSSMAETYELRRNLEFTLAMLKEQKTGVMITKEVAEYMLQMKQIAKNYVNGNMKLGQAIEFWNARNDVKEAYVANTFKGILGVKEVCSIVELVEITEDMLKIVTHGIEKAMTYTDGIAPTYFAFDLVDYEETEDGIIAKSFEVVKIPDFLEGPVRYLKLDLPIEQKQALYQVVKNSDLYDEKLEMYKVNASLEEASFELGRAKAFTPGWLENESIWLHMEYKYLLELIKNGLYNEFLVDFQKAAIPFLDPEVYGRSIYENSSFIASSKNPNPSYHGKGFVARLSGSTVEFLQIWKLMMFGDNNFLYDGEKLKLQFAPTIPKAFIGEDRCVEAMFLGHTLVRYHLTEVKDYIPGTYGIESITLQYKDGAVVQMIENILSAKVAEEVRSGSVDCIQITLQ